MKIVLITTTINVPFVIELYRKFGPAVPIIVIGDEKSPDRDTRDFVEKLGNCSYYGVQDQKNLGHRCSPIIGWNTIMRRNIGILEALRLNPDCIVTVDDDNIPVNEQYFNDIARIVGSPFSGLCAEPSDGYFNAAEFLLPPTFHRGFPYSKRHVLREIAMRPATNAKVGVAAGLWAGDPDVDAMTRISQRPSAYSWARLMDEGMIVSPRAYTPYNTQNTAFHAVVAPLMAVWVEVGRYDDIWPSYVAQRIFRDLGYHVHFGKPFVWQQRNVQNLWKNLENEFLGMSHTDEFIECLEAIQFTSVDPMQRLRQVFSTVRNLSFMPTRTVEAGLAYCDDVDSILPAAR